MADFDYLIVGSGLFGAVFARQATDAGKKCLVIEKRDKVGGNIRCEELDGINVHMYGAHIFHTSSEKAWNYVNRFVTFNNYVNSPIANYKGEIYNMPFNMNTFSRLWGISTPDEAMAIIEEQKKEIKGEPANLEEQAISLVGRDVYEKLVKGYTEKQWGRSCRELPAFIIRRLPVRFTYDNNYFSDRYQGIPIGGYNPLIDALLAGSTVMTGVDYLSDREKYDAMAKKTVYTGQVDAYFGYCLGKLEYRSLRFETERFEKENVLGVAVMNYTDSETPYTRRIEHKHFEFGKQPVSYVTKEYPKTWEEGDEPYYPVNDERNSALFGEYKKLCEKEERTLFGGRLGQYAYYDMDKTILAALDMAEGELGGGDK